MAPVNSAVLPEVVRHGAEDDAPKFHGLLCCSSTSISRRTQEVARAERYARAGNPCKQFAAWNREQRGVRFDRMGFGDLSRGRGLRFPGLAGDEAQFVAADAEPAALRHQGLPCASAARRTSSSRGSTSPCHRYGRSRSRSRAWNPVPRTRTARSCSQNQGHLPSWAVATDSS